MSPLPPLPAITRQPSESVIGSLCSETVDLRRRARQVLADLLQCREPSLFRRLQGELAALQRRRQELQETVGMLQRSGLRDPLAGAFLDELTRRPLSW